MAERNKPWYLRSAAGFAHFRTVPLKHLWILIAAVFFLFSATGFFLDLNVAMGRTPYAVVLATGIIGGLAAALWIVVLTRLPSPFVIGLALLQFFLGSILDHLQKWLMSTYRLEPVSSSTGIHFASNGTMCVIVVSYFFFVAYIRRESLESHRMQNELELAHGIQTTLVPPVTLHCPQFEVYGVSHPSDKVGGDLVDALYLPDGDAIAYVADIAGHGLQAGILMGMLKAAARTALLEAGTLAPDRTLPVVLNRLNTVIPEVKEPHMYATFAGFRLGADGSIFYALAASPPFLHWHAAEGLMSQTGKPQLPLGLLPVPKFDGETLHTASGDLVVVATDGILEVCDRRGQEYGVERMKDVIVANVWDSLPELAEKVLASVRNFGAQLDDQTMLIVRRL